VNNLFDSEIRLPVDCGELNKDEENSEGSHERTRRPNAESRDVILPMRSKKPSRWRSAYWGSIMAWD